MTREELRQELERLVGGYAHAIGGSLAEVTTGTPLEGSKIGYVLMLFDFGEEGSFAYASNGQRADVVRFLTEAREKIARRTQ